MGIVSSTFASLAIRFAWNFQRFLDPRYRYIEASSSSKRSNNIVVEPPDQSVSKPADLPTSEGVAVVGTLPRLPGNDQAPLAAPADNHNSLHQQNRKRRAAQHKYRKRPSSFDVSLIIRNKSKASNTVASGPVTNSTPNTLRRQPPPGWDSTSTDSSDDSEIEFMYGRHATQNGERNEEKSGAEKHDSMNNEKREISNEKLIDDEIVPEEYRMTAAEEVAFRMTVGRGYFSRSKKDRFLNNLRLEKRLNGLNKEFFELACRAHARSARRKLSGELRTIV